MKTYNFILEHEYADEENAMDHAQSYCWSDCEVTEQDRPRHSNHIDTINGVGVWYDFGADYYFFTDEEGEES